MQQGEDIKNYVGKIMMKTRNPVRIFAFLLSALMWIGAFPASAFATISFRTDNGDAYNDNYNIVVSQKDYAIAPGI